MAADNAVRPERGRDRRVLHVQLLTTRGCASCDSVERHWRVLRPAYERQVEVEVIDLLEAPELAVRYGVLRTPALVIDGRLRAQGALDRAALRRLLDAALHDGASGVD